MSDIKDFNDPFDGKAFYYNPDELQEIERVARNKGHFIDDFTIFYKGTALTENDMSCMPMWAHYANNHQGYCVAYDMKNPRNLQLSACTFPIQYTEQRLDITSFMKDYAKMLSNEIDKQTEQGRKVHIINDMSLLYIAQYLCNIKHLSWQYEREFRCTMGTTAVGMPYVDAIPKAVYIGMNCSFKNRNELIRIARNQRLPVYQMKFADLSEEYSLEAELIEK